MSKNSKCFDVFRLRFVKKNRQNEAKKERPFTEKKSGYVT